MTDTTETVQQPQAKKPKVAAILLLLLLLLAKLIARMNRGRLELVYDKKHKLFDKFVKKSKISTMQFEPYFLAVLSASQSILYVLYDAVLKPFV